MNFLYSPYAIVGVFGVGCLIVIGFCIYIISGED